MTRHSVFLRTGCILPDGIGLLREPFGRRWAIVRDMVGATLDRKIRAAGWHFFWLHDPSSSLGFGRTAETAIRSALMRALEHVRGRFNAAELDSLHVAKYPGFRVAKVTLHTRHIQQNTGLESLKEIAPWRAAAL